jgi:hypothetical protein
MVSLTGMLDERPGATYILRGEPDMDLLAVLKPGRFANQAFAKYVGHRVTVRGRLDRSGDEPVMTVTRVERAAAAPAGEASRAEGPAAGSEAPVQALTGIVRRQGRAYVLLAEFTSNVLVRLAPGLAGTEQLQNYVGQKVLVEGRLRGGRPHPVLELERVEDFR